MPEYEVLYGPLFYTCVIKLDMPEYEFLYGPLFI